MTWLIYLLGLLTTFIVLLLLGIPVFLSFLLVNLSFLFIIGGAPALSLMTSSLVSTLGSFSFFPVIFFILMGEAFLHSGLGNLYLDGIDKAIGKLPARLSILAIAGGTIFSTMSGSSMATTAMLGSVLIPEMKKRGYSNLMSCGPILGSGSLAMIIPPSSLCIILATVGGISVSKLLIAGIVPGLLLATLFTVYVLTVAILKPDYAPPYVPEKEISFSDKVNALMPVISFTIIVFLVVGLMLLGVATPSESAALGAVGTFLVVAMFKRLNKKVIIDSLRGTATVAAMIYAIIGFATTFSEVLAISGTTKQLATWVGGLGLPPTMMVIIMVLTVVLMGCFMEPNSIILISMPIFMPLVQLWGVDPIWFGILILIALEMGQTTPPFGLLLFVMKGILPDVSMKEIIISAVPFLVCDVVAIVILFLFPRIVSWLPNLL